jgi:hypothetical protein
MPDPSLEWTSTGDCSAQTLGFTNTTIAPGAAPLMDKELSRLLELAADDIASARSALPNNFAQAKFDLAGWIANDAVRRHIERAALFLRSDVALPSVQSEFDAALYYVEVIEQAVGAISARARPTRVGFHLTNFLWSIVLLMLAGNWHRLATLAPLAHLPLVHEEGLKQDSGGVHDTIVRMLLALLADDQGTFLLAQGRFASKRKIDRFYAKYFCYGDLMQSIIARDNAACLTALMQLDRLFLQRGTDSRLSQLPLLAGSGKDNLRVVDVWALALSRLALYRGMLVPHSSAAIPVAALVPARGAA